MSARLFIEKGDVHAQGKLPDFIIAGIEKAGTTSLFVNLAKHACIEMTPNAVRYMRSAMVDNMKEVHFFNDKWAEGVDWYRGLFNDNDKLQGEAAPDYLFREEYIQRMASVVPHAKIIISLRDPVARAYSQYNYFIEHYRRALTAKLSHLGHDKDLLVRMSKLRDLSFDEAIKREVNKGITVGGDSIGAGFSCFIGKGLYIDLIGNLLKYYPRGQVFIVISEHMKQDMQGTYDKIFDFLSIARAQIDFDMDVLVGKYKKPMSQWAREALNKIYSPYNERLFSFLGYKVPAWDANNECASFHS